MKSILSHALIPFHAHTHARTRTTSRVQTVGCTNNSDRGGEFSSGLLEEFCRDEGICQTFSLPAFPQQNGISKHQTSPSLQWTGKVGDASVFQVWGALSLVRDAKASKLSSRTLRCVFLGFPTDAPPWQLYYTRSRRVFSSQDVTFDESVYFYRLHPHASHPTGGAGSGGVATGGAASPSGSGAVGDPTGGPGVGQPSRLETLSPQQIREWIIQ
ncbi:unnamed protein product [Closterium sp. NIES-53]